MDELTDNELDELEYERQQAEDAFDRWLANDSEQIVATTNLW